MDMHLKSDFNAVVENCWLYLFVLSLPCLQVSIGSYKLCYLNVTCIEANLR